MTEIHHGHGGIDEHELDWQEAVTIQCDLGMTGRGITQFERSVAATPATEIRGQYIDRAIFCKRKLITVPGMLRNRQSGRCSLLTEVASARTVVLLRNVT